jgi:Zn finger protein HypA/HybF involved in hydrogenase expression
MATIVLKTCNNAVEATLIKGKLENNGITCFLTNENFSNLMPHYNGMMGGGVQIIINDLDFENAQKLIEEQLISNEMVCPNCNSDNVSFGLGSSGKIKKIVTIFLSLFVWIPFGNIRNTFYCKDCKTEFRI